LPRLPSLRRKSTPARQVTGTSYSAQSAPGVKPPQYAEIGSAAAAPIIDNVPALSGTQAYRTFTSMLRDDATVRISLRAGKAPVLGAEWYIEPFSSDPQDLAIAEFVQFNLFNGMTTPWIKTLEQILKMFEYGYSVFEPIWELREWAPKKSTPGANRKKYTMLRKLAIRPASTITKFNYDDNGGPVSVDHNAINADGKSEKKTIEIDKLVIFTFDQDGGNLEGNSILRSAYRPWYYKDHLYKIDAIQKERHGIGVPDIELQPGYSDADKRTAHELGANLRTNEKAYIVRTSFMKVGFAKVEGQLVNPLESALHHDNQIMKNIMVHFLNLGADGSGGGRATAATAMDMFLKSMRFVAQGLVADPINLYLIPNLVAYNFPTDRFPQLKARGVGEVKDLQMWASAMKNLKDSNLISIDESTEQWIRAQMDMPALTSEWTPITQRPEVVREQGKPSEFDTGTNGNNSTSPNGGGGNIGKSPSSGAV